jgi:ABC-type Na+ transport system ATPase subunit NatA
VRLVATLLIPDAGHITIFGHDVQREEMQVKRTGKLKRSG